jgi:hypothetical protein
MSTAYIETAVVVSGLALEDEFIRWTHQDDGSYVKEGALPANLSTARIFEIDEDYETNCHAVSSGKKMWPKEEAIALVGRKIADGSYQAWRHEIRPELSNVETSPATALTISETSAVHLCSNPRYKKGPDGTLGVLKSRRAKYCSPSCRVAVSRREGNPTPKSIQERKRKRRSDAKYQSNAHRQRAYRAGLEERRRADIRSPLPSSVTDNRLLEPP